MFDYFLSITKCLSDVLQSTNLDLAKDTNLIVATKEAVQELRSDSYWEKVFSYGNTS